MIKRTHCRETPRPWLLSSHNSLLFVSTVTIDSPMTHQLTGPGEGGKRKIFLAQLKKILGHFQDIWMQNFGISVKKLPRIPYNLFGNNLLVSDWQVGNLATSDKKKLNRHQLSCSLSPQCPSRPSSSRPPTTEHYGILYITIYYTTFRIQPNCSITKYHDADTSFIEALGSIVPVLLFVHVLLVLPIFESAEHSHVPLPTEQHTEPRQYQYY